MEDKKPVSLPENAHRELKPGEKYEPILDPAKKYAEVTPYSVFIGIQKASVVIDFGVFGSPWAFVYAIVNAVAVFVVNTSKFINRVV